MSTAEQSTSDDAPANTGKGKQRRRTKAQIEADKRAEWVSKIADPAQRILARALPDLCAIFGVLPTALVGRPPSKDPSEVARGSVRQLALGAVATLGRALGLTWNAMHARNPAAEIDAGKASAEEKARLHNALRPGNLGCTEVRELRDAHRASLTNAAAQFAALTGLDGSEVQGEIGNLARVRYHQILAEALAEMRTAGAEVSTRSGGEEDDE
jgi:hypothetical protein